jgi:hypothetical protein
VTGTELEIVTPAAIEILGGQGRPFSQAPYQYANRSGAARRLAEEKCRWLPTQDPRLPARARPLAACSCSYRHQPSARARIACHRQRVAHHAHLSPLGSRGPEFHLAGQSIWTKIESSGSRPAYPCRADVWLSTLRAAGNWAASFPEESLAGYLSSTFIGGPVTLTRVGKRPG